MGHPRTTHRLNNGSGIIQSKLRTHFFDWQLQHTMQENGFRKIRDGYFYTIPPLTRALARADRASQARRQGEAADIPAAVARYEELTGERLNG